MSRKLYLNYDGLYCGMDKGGVGSILKVLDRELVLPLNGLSVNYILHALQPYRLEIEALYGKFPSPSNNGFNRFGKKIHLSEENGYLRLSLLGGGGLCYDDFLLSRVISSETIIMYDFLEALFEDMLFIRGVRYLD